MNRILKVIQERGITQTELGIRMGISKAAVSQLLKVGNPTLSTLENIAKVVDVPLWELLISKEQMQKDFEELVIGFVRIKGQSYKIESVEDLKSVLTAIELVHQIPPYSKLEDIDGVDKLRM